MKRMARLLSGALFGGALLTLGMTILPQTAMAASGGFCDETENYLCCCSTTDSGAITQCVCNTINKPG